MRRALTLCAVLFCPLASLNAAFGYQEITPTLINGVPVDPGTWQEVVRITSNGSGCTATVVGPRVIATAAHCAKTGDMASFKYKGANYSARIYRSPIWPGKDQDVAIGVVASDMKDATPHKIGGTATLKTELTLLGYGCIKSPGTGGNDGILRIGTNVIIGFSSYDMVSRSAGGAALCFGDSGGPAFIKNGSDYLLLGINSKGNIKDTNYNSRLDLPETIAFLKDASAKNSNVVICGVTDPCSTTPPPPDPTCTLTANPSSVALGGSVSLVLNAQNAVSADIDGTTVNIPNGEKRVTPTAAGSFNATATVRNSAGKSSTCGASYAVTNTPLPDRPSCTLTAVPGTAKVGETITLELSATGSALDLASIDGNSVNIPVGKLNVTRTTKGDYSATGFIRGSGGSANCFTSYRIEDGTPAPVPEFAITPTHCGANAFPENGIQSACLAVVKTDASWTTAISQVVLVNNVDKTQEVLPILARNKVPSTPGATQGSEQLVTYGGKLAKGSAAPILDTRPLKISKLLAGDVPLSMEGNSPTSGRLYYVNPLSPFFVRAHLPDRRGTL
jgi:hypothetical protein